MVNAYLMVEDMKIELKMELSPADSGTYQYELRDHAQRLLLSKFSNLDAQSVIMW